MACVHQDVYLPEGWDWRLTRQLYEAERRFGPIGVAGVYGVGDVIRPESPEQPLGTERIGWVVDRGRELRDGPELPARVATLDELLLVVRRDSGLRFDPALGFHLYGADLCLQARERGLAVVALGALCQHNSRNVFLPRAFFIAPRFSPVNGATGCRSPLRAPSSTAAAQCTCWATPRIDRDRLPLLSSLTPFRVAQNVRLESLTYANIFNHGSPESHE